MVFSRQNSTALLRLPVQATVKRMSSVLPCTEPTSFLPHQPSPTIAARNIASAPVYAKQVFFGASCAALTIYVVFASCACQHRRESRRGTNRNKTRSRGGGEAMNYVDNRRNESRAWIELPVADNGEAIVAAMTEAGVEYVFFTSGSEIGFYQEAIASGEEKGRRAPRLISVTQEHASLNAALGCAAVSGKPVATAAHVDCGTQHYGGAVDTARHAGGPGLMTAGIPPVAYPGSMRGARDPEGHLWLQQTFDQNGIVRQYTKWDHNLEFQDNPGLMVSRALQVACSEPCGPVYLSIPREVSLAQAKSARFPTLAQLGAARPPAPGPAGIRELGARPV